MPGLHISQGIYLKLFELLEDACHELDLKAALIHSGESILSPSFAAFVQKLQELKTAKGDHGAAQQNLEMLIEVKTYLAIIIGQANSIVTSLEEQSKSCRELIGITVSA